MLAAIARIRLASLSDDVLALVLRDLPRKALLRLRLTCQDVCARVSMLLSDERVSRTLHFERRLRVPDSLAGVRDVAAFLRRLCSRFGIKPNTWSLSLTMRAMPAQANYAFLCGGVSARAVLAAVEAVAPLGIQLVASQTMWGDAEAEALPPVLSTVTRLISLNLDHCKLGAAGATAFAPVLSKMTQLRVVPPLYRPCTVLYHVVPCLYHVVPPLYRVVPCLYHACTVVGPCLYRVVPCLYRDVPCCTTLVPGCTMLYHPCTVLYHACTTLVPCCTTLFRDVPSVNIDAP